MRQIIDISAPVDAGGWEPEPLTHRVMTPAEAAAHVSTEMEKHFGLRISPEEFPGGEFLSNDFLSLSTHTGTHIDAPAHYGSAAAYGVPATVDHLPLDRFCRPGVVLDLTGEEVGAVGADEVAARLEGLGYALRPLDIVLIRTGASDHLGTARYFTDFVGLDGSAVEYLLDRGVQVIGTDAFSLDAPFPYIVERYRQTGDPAVLWPAHVTGRRREYYQLERLANLAALPSSGFTVVCFPVKIIGAGAGWTRAVAMVDD